MERTKTTENIAETICCAKSRVSRNETVYPISVKFIEPVAILGLTTCAYFSKDQLRFFLCGGRAELS